MLASPPIRNQGRIRKQLLLRTHGAGSPFSASLTANAQAAGGRDSRTARSPQDRLGGESRSLREQRRFHAALSVSCPGGTILLQLPKPARTAEPRRFRSLCRRPSRRVESPSAQRPTEGRVGRDLGSAWGRCSKRDLCEPLQGGRVGGCAASFGASTLALTGEYTLILPERHNKLTRRIQRRLARGPLAQPMLCTERPPSNGRARVPTRKSRHPVIGRA